MSTITKKNKNYTGNLGANGMKSGLGTCVYENNEKYVGNWQDDKRSGEGTYYYRDGSEYTGNWKNNKQHGEGTLLYSNGHEYFGLWEEGKRSGKGTYKFSDGSVFEAIWKDDVCMSNNGLPTDILDALGLEDKNNTSNDSRRDDARNKRGFFSKERSKNIRKF
ncbi:MAG: hypothetical protein P8J38_05510 [Thermodesulfobacteriota bacteirum]|nr:hypothetical protein [Thermodesulfobacteriota bacterium]